ncbi:MAG: hypothetical protein COY39_04310 [Alphaproteobacteria bacterium CG_4_10_14_0_8_um_filter_37_21]|nr:MAG: hypothetical protein COY39_04310 [Alphaproteobacteria bacterium CG_4_10_14_0_8_um_filter_37_21]
MNPNFYKLCAKTYHKKPGAQYVYRYLTYFDQEHATNFKKTTYAKIFWGMALALFGNELRPLGLGLKQLPAYKVNKFLYAGRAAALVIIKTIPTLRLKYILKKVI